MHPYYDYCCEELETFGRGLRDKINKVMPTALTDIGMIELFIHIVPGDTPGCPFCHVPLDDTDEKMRDQWTTRYLGGAVLHPPKEE